MKREYRMMPDDFLGGGRVGLMAIVDGYAMVRRPACIPFVVEEKLWLGWERCS